LFQRKNENFPTLKKPEQNIGNKEKTKNIHEITEGRKRGEQGGHKSGKFHIFMKMGYPHLCASYIHGNEIETRQSNENRAVGSFFLQK